MRGTRNKELQRQTCGLDFHSQATLHYLQELQPSTLDPTLDPDALQPKALATLAFVWLYILAYLWRGLFKAGFCEAGSVHP